MHEASEQPEFMETVKEIRSAEEEYDRIINSAKEKADRILRKAKEWGFSDKYLAKIFKVEEALDRLKRNGQIYEPLHGKYKITEY
jgi:vacuolar-type H+-ATPase subunit H